MRVVAIIVGLLLLLPGLCGLAGSVALIMELIEGMGRADSGLSGSLGVVGVPSLVGLGLGWLGIWMLRKGGKSP
jgi:hypothetical protein